MIAILNGTDVDLGHQIEEYQKDGWVLVGPMSYAGYVDDGVQFDYYCQMMCKEESTVLDTTMARKIASDITDIVQGVVLSSSLPYQGIENLIYDYLKQVKK